MFFHIRRYKRLIDGVRFLSYGKVTCARKPSVFLVNSPQIRSYTILKSRDFIVRCDQLKYVTRSKHKSKKKGFDKGDDDESSDEEETDNDLDDDDNLFVGKGANLKIYSVKSLRIDSVLKSVLGISRKKIEDSFYDNKIRISGMMAEKKSYNVQEGDEIDIIKDSQDLDAETLNVTRVQILKIKPDPNTERTLVKACTWKSITIKNYSEN